MVKAKIEKKAVVVTTEHRGVFFGYIPEGGDALLPGEITLARCRNVVYWPASAKGFLGLAASGPPSGSRVGPAAAEVTLYKITSVSTASPEAVEAWERAAWQ